MPLNVRPLNIGLTGNIGSGKSTVAQLFAQKGAEIIDADELAREATTDAQVLAEIARAFGADLVKDERLDRTRLGEIVFGNPEARAGLNAIVHPWVARKREQRVAALSAREEPPAAIVHDIPLLFEVGLDRLMDKTVVVSAPLELRMARVEARSGLSEAAVRARDAAQLPLAEKVERADFIIDNSGERATLERQVARVWERLLGDDR